MNFTPTPEQLESLTGASRLHLVPESEVIFDMPDDDYRKRGAVSYSKIEAMRPTPAHISGIFNFNDTADCRMGRHIHQGVLTPHIPLPDWVVTPEYLGKDKQGNPWKWRGNRKDCELWVEMSEAAGKTVIDPVEHATITGCIQSIQGHQEAAKLLSFGDSEVSIFQTLEIDGVRFQEKSRIDKVLPRRGLLDVKTVRRGEANKAEVRKKIKFEGWGRQAAKYLTRWNCARPDDKRDTFMWIVVEKAFPFVVHITSMDDDGPEDLSLHKYRNDAEKDLETFARCVRNGVFPGDSDGIERIAD